MMSRNSTLDYMRIAAMVMVIFLHASMPDKNVNAYGYILGGINFIFQPAVPIFLMLSGALLLRNTYPAEKFLKRRLAKVLFPTLIWTLCYLLLSNPSWSEFIQRIISIPFSCQGHPILWYMYVLLGLYLLCPILSCWIKKASKREIEFYLSIWLISLALPYFRLFAYVDDSVTGLFYYFNGYVGYFVGGYYLIHYFDKINYKLLIGFACICWISAISLRTTNTIDDEIGIFFSNLSSAGAIINLAWFAGLYSLFSKISQSTKTNSTITTLSSLTFGVYLSHIAIYKLLVWQYITPWLTYYPAKIFIGAISCSFLTFIFCYLISFLPFAQYLIGMKANKRTQAVTDRWGGDITN